MKKKLRVRRRAWLTGWAGAAVVILIAYVVGVWASVGNSATFDEGAYIVGGYLHWTMGEARVHPENGWLPQAIESFPLLFLKLQTVDTASAAFRGGDVFVLGREFLYLRGNDAAVMLFLARAAIGLLMVGTGLGVYAWSRKLFGRAGGILSVVVFGASPLVLAHGFLATSDMAATCFFLLTLGGFAWCLERITPVRLMLGALAMGGLFLSKMSAPVVVPVLLVAAGMRIMRAQRAEGGQLREALRCAGVLLFDLVAVWVLIWAVYGFRYSAFAGWAPDETFRPDTWTWALEKPTGTQQAILFARDHHLLPEAYLYGFAYIARSQREVISYVQGMVSRGGWWWYYPYLCLLTVPLGAMALGVVAVIALVQRKIAWRARSGWVAPLAVFFVAYGAAAVASYRGSGLRYLMPMWPVFCIFCGAGVYAFQSMRVRRWVLGVLTVVLALETASAAPMFLSYFNLIGGPRSKGYRHFVDSVVDWGQGLPELAAYLDAHEKGSRVYFSYFGTADPGYYGIRAIALPSFIRARGEDDPATYAQTLQPGTYYVSVTQLAGLYQDWGRYTAQLEKGYQQAKGVYPMREQLLADPRVTGRNREMLEELPQQFRYYQCARLFAYLRSRRPDDQVACSINVYRLSPGEFDQAMNGPPVIESERVEIR